MQVPKVIMEEVEITYQVNPPAAFMEGLLGCMAAGRACARCVWLQAGVC